ncbi:hypothetical protein [Turneriella parva]|uniref:Uncharacterized protein n=1 Tax=Turneriella parva (strain ATCC BAA-1111 / DSM 21527 / NCTC 11395 / H) TaxID=869212 RepID=I4B0T4_TURPD|nr:hypothetical protein [Turneriella parva]AFM10891.1 hypothetical protein Turpa_0231 [Turneriella parva DSM 21527]
MQRYLLLTVLAFAACKKPVDLKKEEAAYDAYLEALPELRVVQKNIPVQLNVAYVENPHLPTLDVAGRQRVYASVEALARRVYGFDLKITETRQQTIADFFAAVGPRFAETPIRFPSVAFLISWFAPNRDALVAETIAAALKKHSTEKLAEYLGKDTDPAAASRVFLQKLTSIYAEKNATGRPLLSATNRQEEAWYSFGHWSTILQGEKEFDFVLTNVGIIGADNGMPLYVIARGGVTSAFVENNAYRPYQGAGMLGAYPFLSDSPFFIAERGALTATEKEEAIAWLWLHELGHLLLKKEENYSFSDSVHRAPPNLKYHEWVKTVRATKDHRSDKVGLMKKF